MVRMEAIAEASFEARREASRLGIAMAAMMPMIATTIKSSISEKPFWPFFCCISFFCSLVAGFEVSSRRRASSGHAPLARHCAQQHDKSHAKRERWYARRGKWLNYSPFRVFDYWPRQVSAERTGRD